MFLTNTDCFQFSVFNQFSDCRFRDIHQQTNFFYSKICFLLNIFNRNHFKIFEFYLRLKFFFRFLYSFLLYFLLIILLITSVSTILCRERFSDEFLFTEDTNLLNPNVTAHLILSDFLYVNNLSLYLAVFTCIYDYLPFKFLLEYPKIHFF